MGIWTKNAKMSAPSAGFESAPYAAPVWPPAYEAVVRVPVHFPEHIFPNDIFSNKFFPEQQTQFLENYFSENLFSGYTWINFEE